jgi:hypothetical protein
MHQYLVTVAASELMLVGLQAVHISSQNNQDTPIRSGGFRGVRESAVFPMTTRTTKVMAVEIVGTKSSAQLVMIGLVKAEGLHAISSRDSHGVTNTKAHALAPAFLIRTN